MKRLSSTRSIASPEPRFQPSSSFNSTTIYWSSLELTQPPEYLSRRQRNEFKGVRFYSSITVAKSSSVSDYGLDDHGSSEIVYNVGDFVYCAQMEGTDVYYAATIRGLYERPSEKGKEKFKCHLQWFYRTFDTKLTRQQKPPNFSEDSELLVGHWIDENLVTMLRGHIRVVYHNDDDAIRQFNEEDADDTFYVRYKYTEIVGLKPTITPIGDYSEGDIMNEKKLPMGHLAEMQEVSSIIDKRYNETLSEMEYLTKFKGEKEYYWTSVSTIPPLLVDKFEQSRPATSVTKRVKESTPYSTPIKKEKETTVKNVKKETTTPKKKETTPKKREALTPIKKEKEKEATPTKKKATPKKATPKKATPKSTKSKEGQQTTTTTTTTTTAGRKRRSSEVVEEKSSKPFNVARGRTLISKSKKAKTSLRKLPTSDSESGVEEVPTEDEKEDSKNDIDDSEEIDLSISLADYLAAALAESVAKQETTQPTEDSMEVEIKSIVSPSQENTEKEKGLSSDSHNGNSDNAHEANDGENNGENNDTNAEGNPNNCVAF